MQPTVPIFFLYPLSLPLLNSPYIAISLYISFLKILRISGYLFKHMMRMQRGKDLDSEWVILTSFYFLFLVVLLLSNVS